jgi:L-fucose mutarotase/ribose pyranase (RbsD/FucU family)
MPRPKGKKKKTGSSAKKKRVVTPLLNPMRTGMPALDSITGVDEYSKGKQVYRIIHTNEIDEYEQLPPKKKQKSER